MVWRLGALLAIAEKVPTDYAAQQVFLENTIAYSGQNAQLILENLYALGKAKDATLTALESADDHAKGELNQILEDMKCPELRAARTAEALCRTSAAGLGACDPKRPLFAPVLEIIKMGQAGSCPSVMSAPISSLIYQEVPIEDIVLPWSTTPISK